MSEEVAGEYSKWMLDQGKDPDSLTHAYYSPDLRVAFFAGMHRQRDLANRESAQINTDLSEAARVPASSAASIEDEVRKNFKALRHLIDLIATNWTVDYRQDAWNAGQVLKQIELDLGLWSTTSPSHLQTEPVIPADAKIEGKMEPQEIEYFNAPTCASVFTLANELMKAQERIVELESDGDLKYDKIHTEKRSSKRVVDKSKYDTAQARIAELEMWLHGAQTDVDMKKARIAELEAANKVVIEQVRDSMHARLNAEKERDELSTRADEIWGSYQDALGQLRELKTENAKLRGQK